MRMPSTKLRTVLAALAAGALALTACGGGGTTDDPTTSEGQTNQTQEETQTQEEVTLVVSWWGNDERARMMEEVFALFTERHPNIKINAEPTGDPDSLFTRLSTDFASGGGPDLFTLGGAKPQEYGGAGQLLDLATVSEHVALDPYEDFTTTNATVDDKLYGLPTGGNAIGLVVNETIFEEAGVEPPTEGFGWEEFVTKAAEVSANSDGVYGMDLRLQDIIGTYIAQLNDIGVYTWEGDLAVTPEELTSWFEIDVELNETGGTPDASIIVENHNVTPDMSLFGTRKAAMTFAYSNQMTAYTSALGEDSISMMLPPSDTDNSGIAVLPSQFWSINANTEHPQESAMLLDFLLNDVEAAEIIKDNRGLPFNAEVLAVVEPLLDPINAEAAAYIQTVLESGVVAPPQPAGGAEMNSLSQRMESDVLFGSRTVEDAVAYWIEYMTDQLANA